MKSPEDDSFFDSKIFQFIIGPVLGLIGSALSITAIIVFEMYRAGVELTVKNFIRQIDYMFGLTIVVLIVILISVILDKLIPLDKPKLLDKLITLDKLKILDKPISKDKVKEISDTYGILPALLLTTLLVYVFKNHIAVWITEDVSYLTYPWYSDVLVTDVTISPFRFSWIWQTLIRRSLALGANLSVAKLITGVALFGSAVQGFREIYKALKWLIKKIIQ